jgi:hypothetical protein
MTMPYGMRTGTQTGSILTEADTAIEVLWFCPVNGYKTHMG